MTLYDIAAEAAPFGAVLMDFKNPADYCRRVMKWPYIKKLLKPFFLLSFDAFFDLCLVIVIITGRKVYIC